MELNRINKEIFLNTLFCPTLGWRIRNGKIDKEFSLGDRFRMEQGREIGELARSLYPEGIFIYRPNLDESAVLTKKMLEKNYNGTFFEATFISGDCVAKSDILVKNGDFIELIEVKSSLNAKEEHIDDMAYTVLIASNTGICPSTVSLLLLDKNYCMGKEIEFLFKKIDLTSHVMQKVQQFRDKKQIIESVTSQKTEPNPVLSYNCKKCDQFSRCVGFGVDAHIFEIPRMRQSTIEDLIKREICSIHDISDDFPLSPIQKNVVNCVKNCEIEIDQSLSKKLEEVVWPAYYLDFETTMTAIPLYPGISPYDQIPFQYSIHLCDTYGNIVKHIAYLADPLRDCRRELAEQLIHDLEGGGSIISYSNYEKTTISNLMNLFPDLSENLQSLINRIVDLEKFVKCIQHPQFRGRTSIKVVLPVLVPELSYQGLDITDGDTAMVTFALMAKGTMESEEMKNSRAALEEYCMLDTLAMVRLHEELHRLQS